MEAAVRAVNVTDEPPGSVAPQVVALASLDCFEVPAGIVAVNTPFMPIGTVWPRRALLGGIEVVVNAVRPDVVEAIGSVVGAATAVIRGPEETGSSPPETVMTPATASSAVTPTTTPATTSFDERTSMRRL